jgi:hypothetical protein
MWTTLVFLAAAWVGSNAAVVVLRLYVTSPRMPGAETINRARSSQPLDYPRLVS